MDTICIRGARTHNLQNIDLDLPRNRFILITGLSGSGKSSLAFDTLYAEGQRRYVESLSAYARQFLSLMEKPEVDHIEGLSPAISIGQKSTSSNPRSTVGTLTEIYDYLRLLYARVGIPRCPEHGIELNALTVTQMVDQVLSLPPEARLMLLAPIVREAKGAHTRLLSELRAQGFLRVRTDGQLIELEAPPALDPHRRHTLEVVVDRFKPRPDLALRLAESFETALRLSGNLAKITFMDHPERDELLFSARFACPNCGYSLSELQPQLFSFNNPSGACPACDGIGVRQFFDPERIVSHPHLSLADGAVPGWDRHNTQYFQMIRSLAQTYGFDLQTPFRELSETERQLILYGSGDKTIAFDYIDPRGELQTRHSIFEGIIPYLERRYRETTSAAVREELAKYLGLQACPDCHGTRLNQAARHVYVANKNLPEIVGLPLGEAQLFFANLNLTGRRAEIASRIVKEINERLGFLIDLGLDYLTLDRSATTLAGGEAQRIRLAGQIGAGLVGVMYVLDEPSIGLHQRDNQRLLKTLLRLRDMGNTLIVVEHDEEAMLSADHIVDMGPGAGIHGGRIIAHGTLAEIISHPDSLTGQYLAGRRRIALPARRLPFDSQRVIAIQGACGNNLKTIDVEIPLGLMTCVTGVSGSGKSTLINDTLYRHAARELNDASESPAPCQQIRGLEQLDKVVNIDQSPIGRTPRSNPATYTGLFTPIRELFAATREARSRGYSPSRFSFNLRGGRCEACQGDGLVKVEMHFLPDIYVPCDVCHGERYNRETLSVRYKGRNVREVLEMTAEEALAFFAAIPAIAHKLATLKDVGLSYIKLGQNATTLSGGEAQRLKLARELSKRDTGKTLYILDEPTTGLHFHDIAQLLEVLQRLRDRGNTIVIIEHNLEVIKTADWIIDLGPEGGERGGEVVVAATPEAIAAHSYSHTGQFLRPLLASLGTANR